ncbi:MAG: ATP-dependent RNA helicase DbpA [Alcanivoracaceae bacterium]|nr:ATP-dependent RNA helicase DbpA [Alcanivoracaceae bacterium]
MTDTAFSDLPLSAEMLATLDSLGFTGMTPIQAASLPVMLAGRDVIAQAATGSGKTAAFGIALLQSINPRLAYCQALVLCPTRELADQVAQELRRLARAIGNIKVLSLCGGQPMGPQKASLEHGAQVVVGTPGRILKHLGKDTLALAGLKTLVLDEADRMLDMGFYDSIADVIRQAPKTRQTLLFSATYPAGIQTLAADFMINPEQVHVQAQHDNRRIEQRFLEVDPSERFDVVRRVLLSERPRSCLAFCFTRQQCDDLARYLNGQGISAMALHGDMEQRDRDRVLVMFAGQSVSVLVATDVAARGLDIDALDLVINVEMARDAETHVHRIGRTGRAGEKGLAVSLVAPPEVRRAQAVEALQGAPLHWHPLTSLKPREGDGLAAPMVTLCIAAGRKDKLRPGDILGALTGEAGIDGKAVGKIAVTDFQSFVAVERDVAAQALERLSSGRIKGKSRRVRAL